MAELSDIPRHTKKSVNNLIESLQDVAEEIVLELKGLQFNIQLINEEDISKEHVSMLVGTLNSAKVSVDAMVDQVHSVNQ